MRFEQGNHRISLQILVVVFGSICLAVVALASNLGGIVEAAVGVNGMLLGPTLALFTMGWGCPWVNSHVSNAFALQRTCAMHIITVFQLASKRIKREPCRNHKDSILVFPMWSKNFVTRVSCA